MATEVHCATRNYIIEMVSRKQVRAVKKEKCLQNCVRLHLQRIEFHSSQKTKLEALKC